MGAAVWGWWVSSEIDAQIIGAIRDGCDQFYRIVARLERDRTRNGFRYVDRRIQSLRKRGVLTYDKRTRRWSVDKRSALSALGIETP